MQAFQNASVIDTFNSLVSLAFAFLFGTAIGMERQLRQRIAGLRTNALVAIAASAFVELGLHMTDKAGAVYIAAYVVSGVGFLGAGAIMKEGANITGLNTAATLWGSAAVGAMCGAGLIVQAGLVTGFVLAANTLLRYLVLYINTRPTHTDATESNYHMYVVCERSEQTAVQGKLQHLLDSSGYPARKIEKHSLGANDTEIEVLLMTTIARAEQLNAITAEMEQHHGVKGAFWHTSPLTA